MIEAAVTPLSDKLDKLIEAMQGQATGAASSAPGAELGKPAPAAQKPAEPRKCSVVIKHDASGRNCALGAQLYCRPTVAHSSQDTTAAAHCDPVRYRRARLRDLPSATGSTRQPTAPPDAASACSRQAKRTRCITEPMQRTWCAPSTTWSRPSSSWTIGDKATRFSCQCVGYFLPVLLTRGRRRTALG